MMKDAEFVDKYNEIRKQCEDQITRLCIDFAEENKRFKVGDIIQDSYGNLIKMESVKYRKPYHLSDTPVLYYFGKALTKKLQPRKDGELKTLSDHNLDLTKIK